MFILSFWILAVVLLTLSLVKDRKKTASSLLAAWKFFRSLALTLPGIILISYILNMIMKGREPHEKANLS